MDYKNKIYREKAVETVKSMDLVDVIWQLTICNVERFMTEDKFDRKKADDFFCGHSIGGYIVPKTTPERTVELVKEINAYFKEKTTAIPPLVISEMLHGVTSPDATIFPQSLSLGATFDRNLVKNIASAIGDEAEYMGINQGLAPDLDLALDPRWGRVEECYGEDALLVSELGKNYTEGVQKTKEGKTRIAATVKHFALHGTPEGGVNLGPSSIGEREGRRLYLKPFAEVIKHSEPLSVMPAYSENDGIPCHKNKHLLQKILREEMGFDGYLISDFGGINMLCSFHKTASDLTEAIAMSFTAGLDLEAPGIDGFPEKMQEAINRKLITEETVRRRAENVLYVKYALGLFDGEKQVPKPDMEKHRELALKAARESLILLKNKDKILPLDKNKYKTIAVIGPCGHEVEFGDYSIKKDVPKIDEELAKHFENSKVIYEKGCDYAEKDENLLKSAVNLAKNADIVILAIGERSVTNFGIGWGVEDNTVSLCGEGYDSCTLRLSLPQEELCEKILNLGKPTILLQSGGRPLAIGDIYERCDCVFETFYGGEMFAQAFAEIISGEISPSGKLPISIPRSVGNIPCYYHHKNSSRGYYKNPGTPEKPGRDYVTEKPGALYPFGYGESYTKFTYENLKINSKDFEKTDILQISVTVKNDGNYDATETVLLYISDLIASVSVPNKELKGFERITLNQGESKTVKFNVPRDNLKIIDENMKSVFEQGEFKIQVGELFDTVYLK